MYGFFLLGRFVVMVMTKVGIYVIGGISTRRGGCGLVTTRRHVTCGASRRVLEVRRLDDWFSSF